LFNRRPVGKIICCSTSSPSFTAATHSNRIPSARAVTAVPGVGGRASTQPPLPIPILPPVWDNGGGAVSFAAATPGRRAGYDRLNLNNRVALTRALASEAGTYGTLAPACAAE